MLMTILNQRVVPCSRRSARCDERGPMADPRGRSGTRRDKGPPTRPGQDEPAKRTQSARSLTVSSTVARGTFGRVLTKASKNTDVCITRHGVPHAVLVSAARYRELLQASYALDSFDETHASLYAEMQNPEVILGTARGVAATPEEMGRAAMAAARRARGG